MHGSHGHYDSTFRMTYLIDIPPVQSITPGGVSFFNNSLAYVFVLPVSGNYNMILHKCHI